MRRRVLLGVVVVVAATSEGAWGASCQVAANLILNCGFDSNAANWTGFTGTLTHEPTDGRANLGSGEIASSGNNIELRSDCVEVVPSTAYGYGIAHRLSAGSLASAGCLLQVFFYQTSALCTAGGNSGVGGSIGLDPLPADAWALENSSVGSPADDVTPGVFARLVAVCNGAAAHEVRFDDAFLGVGLVPVELQGFDVD